MGFFEENWFWRGTQSAIFYYVSCSPYVEWRHKRRRRNEASRANKQRDEIITTQPGVVRQPAAFQTNEDWLEEILMGPGPPRGWKRDPIADKGATNNDKHKQPSWEVDRNEAGLSSTKPRVRDFAENERSGIREHQSSETGAALEEHTSTLSRASDVSMHTANVGDRRNSSSSASSLTSNELERPARPSLERRFSTAMDNLRDTLRSTIRAENWNWIRYERDDEILSGFNQRMTDMWNKATTTFGMAERNSSGELPQTPSQRRPADKEVKLFDYEKYTRNPEINDLHPPVVSRLPVTRDEAAWMRLPPPSAAVMEGKIRPQDEVTMRWPLSYIGRTPEDWTGLYKNISAEQPRLGSRQAESIPGLSDSYTEASSSSDEEAWKAASNRHSEPALAGNGSKASRDQHNVLTGSSSIEPQPVS